MEWKRFDDYYPMADHPSQGVVGARTWLAARGRKYAKFVHALENEPGLNPDRRRLLLVGAITEEGLTEEFLRTCWTQGCRDLAGRREKMKMWYDRFEKRADLNRWLRQHLDESD